MPTHPDRSITVAAVQAAPVFLDRDASTSRAAELIAAGAESGARVIVFPETWLPGYPVWLDAAPGAALWDHPPARQIFTRLVENAVTVPGKTVTALGKAARKARAVVVMGIHERIGNTLYNTILYLGPDGDLLGRHRKLMPTYSERMIWGLGREQILTVVDTPLGRVGGLVCWEHWMPLARQAMHEAREMVHAAQWPWVKEMNLVASRHYAFEGRCFVVAAGAVLRKRDLEPLADLELLGEIPGEPDEFLLRGGSAIIAPDGRLLAGPLMESEGILSARIDPREATEGHLTLDVAGHYARPDILQLSRPAAQHRPQSG